MTASAPGDESGRVSTDRSRESRHVISLFRAGPGMVGSGTLSLPRGESRNGARVSDERHGGQSIGGAARDVHGSR